MKSWNLYNASMEIAARCNAIFSKLFVYRITNFMALWIDATPTYSTDSPYDIHMVANKGGNTLEVYLNFHGKYSLSYYDEEDMNAIAYSIGHDVADRFAIAKNNAGFIFFFGENLTYLEYENEYKFVVDGEIKVINSDFPLINYMKTEFDLEFLMFNETHLEKGISEITKNGKPLFDIVQYKAKPKWGILRIEKNLSGYNILLQDCNFFNSRMYNLKVMSYLGQYSTLEKIPTLDKKIGFNPFIEIYFSADYRNYIVYVERIRNYGLTPIDLRNSIPFVCEKIGIINDVNWAEYLNF